MFKSRFKQYIKFREKLLIIVLQLLLGLERKESLITKSLDIFLFQYNDIKLNCPHLHKIIIHSKDDKCAWKWPCNLWTMISRYGHYRACNLHIHLLFVGIDTFHSFDEFFTFKCFQHFIELGLNKIRFHSDITDPQAFVARLFNDFIDNFFLLVTFDGRSVGFQLVK